MKVLIVDDDEIQRMILVDLLSRFDGIEAVEAVDGDSAWQELQRGLCPVMCCCDMSMPGMSGMDLLRLFKSNGILANVPFIFITSATDRDTVTQAIASGATNYILKPFDLYKERSKFEKIFRSISEKYSESPLVTQKRLDIKPEKMLGYFDALKQQIIDNEVMIEKHLNAGEITHVRSRLDNLKTSCLSLGVLHAALTIEYLGEPKSGPIKRILNDVKTLVEEQRQRCKVEFGIQGEPGQKAASAPTDN